MRKVIFFLLSSCLLLAIFIFLNTGEQSPDSDLLISDETSALYAEPLIFEELIKNKADAIVIGTVESKGEPFVSVVLEESALYSIPYTVEIDRKLKGLETKETVQVNILEPNGQDIQIGDQIFLFAVETKPDYYVPLTAEYGLKTIQEGKVIGRFLKEEHRRESIELPGNVRGIELETFVEDIESVLGE